MQDKPESMRDQCCSRNEVADFILLALKAGTHHILYLRHVYPEEHFRRERIFDTYTQASRYPALKHYIADAVDSLKVLPTGVALPFAKECGGQVLANNNCKHNLLLIPQHMFRTASCFLQAL
jgi:hypothetical protein